MYNSTINSSSWMHDSLSITGDFTLRNLCILGSHDSGMCKNVNGTVAPDCSVITQKKNVLEQLHLGVRYFDIRPIVGSGSYHTGHYSNTPLGWLGGRGQSIEEIVDQINEFCKDRQELVVLELSHAYDTDNGYKNFDQDQWNGLFKELSKIENLYHNEKIIDLTSIKLNSFIGNGKSCVIVVARACKNIGSYSGKGFFKNSQYSIYNEYSSSSDVEYMMYDQSDKMKQQRKNRDSECFLLSWTLTQSNSQAATCGTGLADSILKLASDANNNLGKITSYCTTTSYPNVINVDDIGGNKSEIIIVMQINKFFATGRWK